MPPKMPNKKPSAATKMQSIDTSGGNVFSKEEHDEFCKFIIMIEPEIKRLEEKASSEKKADKGVTTKK